MTFADTYYQTTGLMFSGIMNGRPIPGAYNLLVNDKVSSAADPHAAVWNDFYLQSVRSGSVTSTPLSMTMDNMTGWTATGTWGIASGQGRNGGTAITDSPGGNYGNSISSALTLANAVTVPAGGTPTLSFWSRYALESGYDKVWLDVSTDNGSQWTNLSTYTGTQSAYTQIDVPLTAYAGQSLKLRFRFTSDSNTVYDGFYVDDVSISAQTATGYGLVSAPALRPASNFYGAGQDHRYSNPNLVDVTTGGVGHATLIDNDPPPVVSVEDVAFGETSAGTVNATATVRLSAASGKTTSVSYATLAGTATAGSDYTDVSGILTFQPGQTVQTIAIPVIGDARDEFDETVLIGLSNPLDLTIGRAQGTLTIVDDDPPPTISVADASMTETTGAPGTLTFSVALSAASEKPISVHYQTVAATAVAGDDYVPVSGDLSFAPGQTAGSIVVNVVGDALDEFDETLGLSLSNPINATLARADGVGSVLDDDLAPSLSIADVSLLEGDQGSTDFTFSLNLSAPSGKPIAVHYATSDGTAIAPADYQAAAGTVTFDPGQTAANFVVKVIGDARGELDKSFAVNLSSPANVTLGRSTAQGTIINDDPLYPHIEVFNGTAPISSGQSVAQDLGAADKGQPSSPLTFTVRNTGLAPLVFSTVNIPAGVSLAGVPSNPIPVNGEATFSLGLLADAAGTVAGEFSFSGGDPGQGPFHFPVSGLVYRALAFSAASPVSYLDASGTTVSVSMTGAGTGRFRFTGDFPDPTVSTAPAPAHATPVGLVLDSTNSASIVHILTPAGKSTVINGRIDTVNASLGMLDAASTNLAGSVHVGGTLGTLLLNNVSAGALAIGTLGAALTLTLHDAINFGVQSRSPLGAVSANSWVNTAAVPASTIHAPSANTITVHGDLGVNLLLDGAVPANRNSLTKLSVGGTIDGATIRSAGSIGTVTASRLRNSYLLAGVSTRSVWPTALSNFTNRNAAIGSVTLAGLKGQPKAATFINSVIAGPKLGTLSLRLVTTRNSGKLFGVIGDTVTTYSRLTPAGSTIKLKNLAKAASTLDRQDDYRLLVL